MRGEPLLGSLLPHMLVLSSGFNPLDELAVHAERLVFTPELRQKSPPVNPAFSMFFSLFRAIVQNVIQRQSANI